MLGFIVCSFQIQLCGQISYSGQYIDMESTDVFEHEGHYYIACNDFAGIAINDLYSYILKISPDFSQVDTLTLDFSPILGRAEYVRGEFIKRGGELEYVGMGAYRHDLSNAMESLEDTTYLIRFVINDDFSIGDMDEIAFPQGYFSLKDLVYDNVNQRYVFSATANNILYYWVGAIESTFESIQHSNIRVHNIGSIFSGDNPLVLTKVIPREDEIFLRIDQFHTEIYSEDLVFDSVYTIPQVNWTTPYYGWMSHGLVDMENSYFVASSRFNRSYVLHLAYPGQYIHEFSFFHGDSVVTESLYKCLDSDADQNLFIGMHIRSEEEDHPHHMKVIKCDTLGNLIWQSTFGEDEPVRYQHREILTTSDGGVLMMADRYSDPDSDFPDGMILYKLNGNGSVLGSMELDITRSALLVYPNPASDYIRIPKELVGLDFGVYSSEGKQVLGGSLSGETIFIEQLNEGVYTLSVHADTRSYSSQFVVRR